MRNRHPVPVKYIPSWMPGAGWKRAGERLRIISLEIADEPYRRVKQLLVSILAEPIHDPIIDIF